VKHAQHDAGSVAGLAPSCHARRRRFRCAQRWAATAAGGRSSHAAASADGKLDEPILSAAWAKPRGATTAAAGGGLIAGEIGARWTGKHRKGAEGAGISVGNPGAVAVTATSLVTMSVKVSAMGAIKEVTEVLSVVPLEAVDELKVKRAGLTGVMEITVGESSFKLEGKPGDMKEFADVFEQAKATATA
jgi:hypothetical protein